MQSAQTAWLLANAFFRSEEHPEPYEIDDFMMYRIDLEDREQTPEQMLDMIIVINAALGGKVVEDCG
ncbi:MAG: hypothetical protein WC378_18300 [Opitutaceae bacterium]|jgi:hypothetical protein